MPYVSVPPADPADLLAAAESRWGEILTRRPDLKPAIELQRRLITTVVDATRTIAGNRLPRLSLSPSYVAAKLARGAPAFSAEPIPIPVSDLAEPVRQLCRELSEGGAGGAADRIREAIESGSISVASLLAASLARDQEAIRQGATHRGLAPDLVWLVAELAVSPFAHALQQLLFGASADPIVEALQSWQHGYCPSCGSWPALAEVVGGQRILRCSFCAAGWELSSYACIYCGESGHPFVTAAPDEERKDRRIEVCGTCGAYLKTVDVAALSPFPLLAIADLDTMDLDVAAMGHGYGRPPLKAQSPRSKQSTQTGS
jgi:FdhE protein